MKHHSTLHDSFKHNEGNNNQHIPEVQNVAVGMSTHATNADCFSASNKFKKENGKHMLFLTLGVKVLWQEKAFLYKSSYKATEQKVRRAA